MLGKTVPRPLTLEIEGHSLTFPTLADFEFALASRMEVPTAKITRLVRLSEEALEDEARAIGKVEKLFVDLVAAAAQDQAALGRELQGLEIKLFSQDHQWRSIMSGLREQEAGYDAYRKIALAKYMQYLAARQEIVKSIAAERRQRALGPPVLEKPEEGRPGHLSRDTIALDPVAAGREAAQNEGFVRLPKGEAVSIPLPAGQEFTLSLAGHHFSLIEGEPTRLVDENGDQHTLQQGKNLIGRELGNHIVVDSSHRDVSRKHLLIDLTDPHVARLTDMSSHGTFVPADILDTS